TVVPNNESAEQNLLKARKNLNSTAKYASGSETEVSIMATIDYNIPNGISRAALEQSADGILLGWPSKPGIIEELVGEQTESILNKTDTNLFMCSVDKPLVSHRRILMFCPPLTESELGFDFCLAKMMRLSGELSLPIHFVCIGRTRSVIEAYLTKNKTSTVVHFEVHNDWDDLSKLNAFVKDNDLVVFVSARQGEVSYRYSFDRIPKKLGNVYSQFNRIL